MATIIYLIIKHLIATLDIKWQYLRFNCDIGKKMKKKKLQMTFEGDIKKSNFKIEH